LYIVVDEGIFYRVTPIPAVGRFEEMNTATIKDTVIQRPKIATYSCLVVITVVAVFHTAITLSASTRPSIGAYTR